MELLYSVIHLKSYQPCLHLALFCTHGCSRRLEGQLLLIYGAEWPGYYTFSTTFTTDCIAEARLYIGLQDQTVDGTGKDLLLNGKVVGSH